MIKTFLDHQFLRMKIGAVMIGCSGLYFAYDQYDKKAHYIPAQARVSNVAELCYMEKKSGRATTTSDVVACDVAHYAVKNHPKWQGFTVRSKIRLEYEYVSPVDNRTHSGKRIFNDWPEGKKLSRGEAFMIRASKTDPNKSREI